MLNLLFSFPEFIYGNIDLILLAVFVIFTLVGIARGFCSQLAGLITTVIGFILACIFARSLCEFISTKTPWVNELTNSLSGWVTNTFPTLSEVDVAKIAENLQSMPFPQAVKNTIASYAVDETGQTINLCYLIAKALAGYIMLAICFVGIFIAVKIVFMIFRGIARGLRNITLIRLADDLLGGLLAFVKTLLAVYFIVFLINIMPFSFLSDLKLAMNDSKVISFIMEYNLFDYLLKLLQL